MRLRNKVMFTVSLILAGMGIILITSSVSLGKLKIIACDVGQGDAGLIVTPGGAQILIDGGPGKKVLECLSAKMPFWDRKVEMMVLTHPQKDHMEGLISVLRNYEVGTIIWTGAAGEGGLYSEWMKSVNDEGAKIHNPRAGERLLVDGVSFDVLWPTGEKLDLWQREPPADLNDTSVVVRANFEDKGKRFCEYFTGDIPKEILEKLITRPCEILKVSHHGSKTGTNEAILAKAAPKIAIIQVGKNSYGHPTKEVLDLLKSAGAEIFRNDLNGVVEITFENGGLRVSIEN